MTRIPDFTKIGLPAIVRQTVDSGKLPTTPTPEAIDLPAIATATDDAATAQPVRDGLPGLSLIHISEPTRPY